MKNKTIFIPINPYNRPGKASKPARICVHYTGDVGAGADILALFYSEVAAGMFPDKPQNWTSAHYIVGLYGEIIRVVPDNEVAYAASGKNSGTIHIEVCYKQSSGEFEQASKNALRELVLALMKKYNISSDNVVRHYDLTGKLCPYFYIDNKRWAALHKYITTPGLKPATLYRVQVGAFTSKTNANNYMSKIKAAGFSAFLVTENEGSLYRVQVGAFSSRANANAFLKSLKKDGFDGFIIKTTS